jgi:transcriptional regulator with XRE-family HTH domain
MPRSNLRLRFANNVRRLRRERGLTQDAMASLADVDRTYVSSLENCGNAASLDMVAKIATVLGVDPVVLLERRPAPPRK